MDHFKQVNDKYGHQIGDEVLILACILKSTSRGLRQDLHRFGGEEFVILLPCPDHETAVLALERKGLLQDDVKVGGVELF